MSFVGIEIERSPAKRRDGSGDIIQGKFTKKRVIVCVCDQCGARITKKYKKGNLTKYQEGLSYCDQACADQALLTGGASRARMSTTCLKKYGVDNPAKLPETRAKIETTCFEKYGTPNYLGSQACEQATRSYLAKRGVSGFLALPEVQQKYLQAIRTRYAVQNPSQSPEVKRQKEQTSLDHFGVPYPSQRPEARLRFSRLARTPAFQAKRHATLMRNGVFKRQASRGEDEVFAALVQAFPQTQRHVRVHRWNIDFFIPELGLYVNYNGVYWHGRYLSDADLRAASTRQSKVILGTKQRDQERETWFREQGLQLEIIWEDEREEAVAGLLNRRNEVSNG